MELYGRDVQGFSTVESDKLWYSESEGNHEKIMGVKINE
ncbi:hypothetical protein B4069_4015 [Bacillus subtilis]|uniref:Uncharacterized protein n=1 Tax=Bacillus subtilis TaxID=1423 RepID=A0A0C3FCK7_BACIU|nr:hypothetical protein B4069_4015 [Bacillus subtilis]KIN35074.1 hypothetical protein B4068_3828 [Bacillus subtilis]KIN57567.1 hypothetical protein B4145_4136 [Bacillus subtilis]KIU06107.1 hypothetical protein SC09_contig4orf01127 [Bacillus subtilis]